MRKFLITIALCLSLISQFDGSGMAQSGITPKYTTPSVYTVASQAAMLALAAKVGDYALRTDTGNSYILKTLPASVLGNWAIISNYQPAPWLDASNYATLALAEAAAYAAGKTLVVSTSVNLVANLNVRCPLKIVKGGLITQTGSFIITMSSDFEAGPYQVFSGFSPGQITGLKEARPEWFATNTTPGTTDMSIAINSAIGSLSRGGTCYLQPTRYAVSETIRAPVGAITILLKGAGWYNTTLGTSIEWRGAGNTSIIKLSSFMVLEDMYIVNGNASPSLIGVDLVGDLGASVTTTTIRRVHVKACATGYAFNYSWYVNLYDSTASYCDIGYDLRTEANNINFFGCHISTCGVGITSTGTGARQMLWSGGSIEGCTTYGISTTVACCAWKFDNPYLEGNYQHKIGGFTEIFNVFLNHEGGSGARPPFDIYASGKVTLDISASSADIPQLFTLSGDDDVYARGSLYVSNPYRRRTVAKSLYGSSKLKAGVLHRSCFEVIETPWIDASSPLDFTALVLGESWSVDRRYLVAAYIVVDTPVVVSGGHFTVTFGFSQPTWNQTINHDFTTDVPEGVTVLPIVGDVEAVIETYFRPKYKFTGTAETSGRYKIVLIVV